METSNKKENKLKKILAPDLETQKELRTTFRDISYFLIIGIISIIVVFIIPLISGAVYGDIGMYFPKTTEGWIVYWCIRGGSVVGNVAVFVLFKQQAKMNIRNNENYLKAKEILSEHFESKEFIPRSPRQMNLKEYIIKVTSVIAMTILSGVTISALAISFDFITFLSCVVSTVIAICFGWVTMIKNEIYWTEEYLEYAKYVDKKIKESEEAEKQAESAQTDTESKVSEQSEELPLEAKEEAECSTLETKNSETCKSK